jgi:hypothetical protein
LTTETQRHREEREKKFSALFSAALCVLCGKKTFNAEVAEECAEDAEKKILSVSLCFCGSLPFRPGNDRAPGLAPAC